MFPATPPLRASCVALGNLCPSQGRRWAIIGACPEGREKTLVMILGASMEFSVPKSAGVFVPQFRGRAHPGLWFWKKQQVLHVRKVEARHFPREAMHSFT